ncbi:MAG TPA: HAD-IC family P-type ATPase, partial [Actinopolymorphaceae bacterium]|nr:HAD-IC family P-type ATPase [Actinopolymorphaceae bacterium]
MNGLDPMRSALSQSEGLSEADASRRLERYGPNAPPRPPRTSLWVRIRNQLRDPLILVLLAAVVLTLSTRDVPDGIVIMLVIIGNTAVGITQEVRADRAVEQLSALAAPVARVLRAGVEREIPVADVVPGDLLVLAEGEIVPADAELVEAVAFATDESMLTGEAMPVDKGAATTEHPGDPVSAGTVVVRGRGRAVVTATGAESALGQVAALLSPTAGMTPLQRRLAGVARVLALAAAVLCAVVLVVGLARGQPPELMALTAISLMVAAVPESLPAVVTLGLALGARRMAARHAIVRRLPAVETLGSVTVIATDKTGTLTAGSMVVQKLWSPAGEGFLTGAGYAPHGQLVRDGRPVEPAEAPDLEVLVRACVLCTDAALLPPPTPESPEAAAPAEAAGTTEAAAWGAIGDPTEAALLAAGGKLGLSRSELERDFPRVTEIPFDNTRRRMTTVHRVAPDQLMVICKGAPEVVLRRPVVVDDPGTVQDAAGRAEKLAEEGYRVLAVASGHRSADRLRTDEPVLPADLDEGLHLLGLVAIADPPRTSAAATIDACQNAGITPVLITGDHGATARAVARQVGIGGDEPIVVDGAMLGAGSVPDVRHAQVFARTSPRQKLDLIEAYQSADQIVAM